MKPEGALELSVSADLTFYSLSQAHLMATDKLFPTGEYVKDWWTLIKVASQDIGIAVPLAYAIGARVELDCGYRQDEWSVTVGYYDMHPKEFKRHEVTVWSEGA